MSSKETLTEVNEQLSLLQHPEGLQFGTDALLLAAFVRRAPYSRAVEYGTGSGIISMLLAKRGKLAHITALEIQETYASLAARNVSLNGLSDSITVLHKDLRTFREDTDVVFCNPPYMKQNAGFRNASDIKFIARHEVMGEIEDFCVCASACLKFGGLFYCVYRPDRLSDLFAALHKAGLEPKRAVLVYRTVRHEPCLVLLEAKKGSACGLRFLRPLILASENGDDTDDMKNIYQSGDFYD